MIRFRDDYVSARSAETMTPYGEPIDDGRGPGERDRVRALGYANPQQVCSFECALVPHCACEMVMSVWFVAFGER